MNKAVTRTVRRVREVVASVRLLAGKVASVLDPVLGAYLRPDEALDGAEAFQITMAHWIEDGLAGLEQREMSHREAEDALKALRLARDGHRDDLYDLLLSVRRTFEDAFGPGLAWIYLGLPPKLGELSRDLLERHARYAAESLESPNFATPRPKVAGLWEHPLRYASQIRRILDAFQATLRAIEAQNRRVEVALRLRNEHLAELKARLRWSTRFYEALYHLTGLGFHAERLRGPTPSRAKAEAEAVSGSSNEETRGVQADSAVGSGGTES